MFWQQMADILRLGFASDGGNIVGPYLAARILSQSWNPQRFFSAIVVVASNVAVHERPSLGSRVIERLSYDVVKMREDSKFAPTDPDSEGYVWYCIRTPHGQYGYVYSKMAHDPCYPVATFSHTEGQVHAKQPWELISFGEDCD